MMRPSRYGMWRQASTLRALMRVELLTSCLLLTMIHF
ncbi:hypothetical protein FOCG_18313 [Fusarium oxysporum f. sp. radicis-lycopersici 26381]|nr:hypothetical protein FOCG_18313 [Fusarium oxysporum f. sp. radicis-lycopersici 26381]